MPLWTFYAYIGMRGAKIAILTVSRFPSDWIGLKELLRDAARMAYSEHGTIEATWIVERHVRSKAKVWRPTLGSYSFRPFSSKRDMEAQVHMVYSAASGDVEVKTAIFAPRNYVIAREFKEMERDVKYQVPPLIPQTFKSFMENPRVLLQELSTLRYPDYSKTARLKYDRAPEKHVATHVRTYLPWGEKVRESSRPQ